MVGSSASKDFSRGTPADSKNSRPLLPKPAPPSPLLGQKLANFGWTALDGSKVSAQDLAGKVVVVDFWATWCAPCKEELPSLQALHDAVDPPVVIGINVKEPEGRVRTFLNHAQLNLPVVLDGRGELARQWGVRIYPTTVVLGLDGRARWRVVGDLDWNGPLARGWLASVKPTP